MSYKKKYTKTKQMYPQPKGTKKDAIQDRKIERITRRIVAMEPEQKYRDVYDTSPPVAGMIAINLTRIGQGDDFDQRIGEEIRASNLHLNVVLTHGAIAFATMCRMFVVWDKQSNGSGVFFPLASIDLAQGFLDDSTVVNQVQSPLNYRCKERYSVLYEHTWIMNPSDPATTQNLMVKKKIPLSNAIIKYSDSSSLATSLTSRSLLVVYYGMVGSVAHVTTARLHYTDA